jgi:tetratricopeptide (TPR) repeat protein
MRYLRTPGLAWLIGVLAALAADVARADEPAKAPPASKPPWQRLLQGEDAKRAGEQEKQLAELQAAGKFEDALKVAEALLQSRERAQGQDHWEAVNARQEVEAIRRVLRQGREARDEYAASFGLADRAEKLIAAGRAKEAQPLQENVLAVRRKVLGEEHPLTAAAQADLAFNLHAQGKYAEAEEALRKALEVRRKVLGEEHPDIVMGYTVLGLNRYERGKYAEAEEDFRKALDLSLKVYGEAHRNTVTSYQNVAAALNGQGLFAQAEEGFRKALGAYRQLVGEEHAETARGYNNLAANLQAQGRYAEAEEDFRKALDIYRKLLGEEHQDTARAYHNLAYLLSLRGKFAEAEEQSRKALALRRKLLGEDHPHTALAYSNLAYNLQVRGRYAEAEEGFRRALAIDRRSLGEEHPTTAGDYNNVAFILHRQGRYEEASEGDARALAIRRKVLGEEHPALAESYNNLAADLAALRRYAGAEEFYRKALAISRKAQGEGHPRTALAHDNLANTLQSQGRPAEAEEGFRTALAISRKALGEEHPETGRAYKSLAGNLAARGRYDEAEGAYGQALAVFRKALGEEHQETAGCYHGWAQYLNARGRYAEAEAQWTAAADGFAKARLRIAASGLERAAKTGEGSPLPHLAAVLARNGKPEEAWRRFEEGLARGTWDDLSARLARPADEQARQADLSARVARLDQLIENAQAIANPTPAQARHREDLLAQRRQAQDALDAFAHRLEETYGAAAGQVFDRERIQKALPRDAALIGWLDLAGGPKAADPDGEHWAVVLRSAGPPAWVRLRGSGPKGAWTDDDVRLWGDLRAALQAPQGDWRPLAARLRRQRLDPLTRSLAAAEQLPAVAHLIVLPSPALAGVPVEVIAEGRTVSYALSGTLYAHLRRQPRVASTGLLGLADPVFDPPALADKPPPLPAGGLLLTAVAPGSNAAQAGLKPYDVLLRYNGADLSVRADLKPLPESDDADKRVAATAWRDGKTFECRLRPGKLGVVLADDPAPKALADLRRLDRRLATRGGDGQWEQLPGTRAEVEAIRQLFANDSGIKLLVDAQASEQQLYELAKGNKLGEYRYLHLATHGEVDDRFPLRSALILSRDALPDPAQQLDAGLPVYDGRLTAEEVLRQWHLKSELVTLSACQTALGKYERGEGHVGFAQALLLAGSRAVCLSQWKVNDAATALLMERFYQNLLGKREGLKGPLPKAQALAEAKEWLRQLPREEALKRAARLTKGVERGKGRPVQPLLPEVPAADEEGRPYAHPYYWAAFVLIGDPE